MPRASQSAITWSLSPALAPVSAQTRKGGSAGLLLKLSPAHQPSHRSGGSPDSLCRVARDRFLNRPDKPLAMKEVPEVSEIRKASAPEGPFPQPLADEPPQRTSNGNHPNGLSREDCFRQHRNAIRGHVN